MVPRWCDLCAIVQCIFGALFLGLGCNIFLVLCLWCYALLAISRSLVTAVAHLLYNIHFISGHTHGNEAKLFGDDPSDFQWP